MHLYAIYGDHLHHWRILRHKKAYYFYSKSVHVLWINWNNKIFMVSHFFYHSWLTAINQKFYASIDILDLVVCVCMCVFVLVTRACKREITISGIDFCQDICTKNKQNVYKSVYIVIWTWLNTTNLICIHDCWAPLCWRTVSNCVYACSWIPLAYLTSRFNDYWWIIAIIHSKYFSLLRMKYVSFIESH